jgi:hypothetical protein
MTSNAAALFTLYGMHIAEELLATTEHGVAAIARKVGNTPRKPRMSLYVAGVAASRRIRRGCPLDEVDGNREAAALVAAFPATSIGEIGCQLLRRCLVGAGGVPPPAFPTGERVDALVDHGVVAVTLACDVALHDVLLQRDRRGRQPDEQA